MAYRRKFVIRFSYTVRGWNRAAKFLVKQGREDLVLKWKDDWQNFMVIFEANVLNRQLLKEKRGAAKRKPGDH